MRTFTTAELDRMELRDVIDEQSVHRGTWWVLEGEPRFQESVMPIYRELAQLREKVAAAREEWGRLFPTPASIAFSSARALVSLFGEVAP